MTCFKARRNCSLTSEGMSSLTTRDKTKAIIAAALLQMTSSTTAVQGLSQNALSSALLYHLFQLFTVYNPEMIELTTSRGSPSVSLDLEVAKVGGKTREMSPLRELLALCCMLQACRITNHSSVVGSFHSYRESGSLETYLHLTEATPLNIGVIRQPAVQALRVLIKETVVNLLEKDCVAFFETDEGAIVLQIAIVTLLDQGGLSEGLEVGTLALRSVATQYTPGSPQWRLLFRGRFRHILQGVLNVAAHHLSGSYLVQMFPSSVFCTIYPVTDQVEDLTSLTSEVATSIVSSSEKTSQFLAAYFDQYSDRLLLIQHYLLYEAFTPKGFRKCWNTIMECLQYNQRAFRLFKAHASVSSGRNAKLILHNLATSYEVSQVPSILACFRTHPAPPPEIVEEVTDAISELVAQAIVSWELRHHYTCWEMYEYLSDGFAKNLWYARLDVLDLWRAAHPAQVVDVFPALRFASTFSALACTLCDELASPLGQSDRSSTVEIDSDGSMTLSSVSDEIVERAVADLSARQ